MLQKKTEEKRTILDESKTFAVNCAVLKKILRGLVLNN